MEYISTRNEEKIFSFRDVFLKGLSPDGGLFVPKNIPFYDAKKLKKFASLSYNELASKIIFEFTKDEFNEDEIKRLVNNSYKNFRVKDVVKIRKLGKLNLLELFHGPTLAFKDIAMQVIGNMYEKILKENNLKVNIVVATSGDTGAAAISAIKDRNNMKIFVLHPENKISEVQRKFMTTVDSKNVFNIALEGDFDKCQKFVKLMFNDKIFNNSINMSGVNSINWSRIIAQIVYYFFSYFQVAKVGEKINFSVPTGNFGDIYAGYIARKMGLPIDKLIIATNKNDILNRVLNTGFYKPMKVEQTISPSMDIQISSNFERLIFDICNCSAKKTASLMYDLSKTGEFKLNNEEMKKIRKVFYSESLSDDETKLTISEAHKNEQILIDPHTAVALGVLKKIATKGKTIVLSTAHPSKFFNTVEKETNSKPELPEKLKNILTKKEHYKILSSDINIVKKYILEKV